jgi:hypothetical protein
MRPGTIESLVRREHRRVDALFAETLDAIGEGEGRQAVRESFARLRETLEDHLEQEDRLYYPALRALRPTHRDALLGFAEAHVGFRARLAELDRALVAETLAAVQGLLGGIAQEFAQHESGEERLLREIDAEVRAEDGSSA